MIRGLIAVAGAGAATLILMAAGVCAAASQSAVRQEVPDNFAAHPAPEQPLPFSHKKHATIGLKCDGCHTNPDPGQHMGFPPTSTCMGCHVAIAADKPAIVTLKELSTTDHPIPWVRVYELTPGVNWTHRAHLRAGMRCEMCHGPVAQLDQMAKVTSITAMASCISCHAAHNARRSCDTCHSWPLNQYAASGSSQSELPRSAPSTGVSR